MILVCFLLLSTLTIAIQGNGDYDNVDSNSNIGSEAEEESNVLFRKSRSTNNSYDIVYIMTTAINEPFVMLKHVDDNGEPLTGNDRYEGYCVDLIKKIQEIIGPDFKYIIRLASGGKFGKQDPATGKWSGMIGEILTGYADFALPSIAITKARERVVDFTKPYMTTGISIMVKKPEQQEESLFRFLYPFSWQVWMNIAIAYIRVSVVIFVVIRLSPYEGNITESQTGDVTNYNNFTLYNCLWYTLAGFMQQGNDILPRAISGRLASSAWWFFTIVIVSSYTANLAAFLTAQQMKSPIENVYDLAAQTKIRYGIQSGDTTEQFFEESTVETYKRMWDFMSSQVPTVFVNSYAEGIKRVRESKGKYLFLLESTANEYINSRPPCDTMKLGDNLNYVGYGIVTKLGSKLKNKFNLAILELQELGELKRQEQKWWQNKQMCSNPSEKNSSSLDMGKLIGIFYILAVGMLISILCAFGEYLHRKVSSCVEAKKEQNTAHSLNSQTVASLSGERLNDC